jgi:hypothetical protein
MKINHTVIPIIEEKLSSYIDNYSVFEFSIDSKESFRFKVPPTGFPTLLFCYGNKVNFFQHKHLTNESILVGQLSKHINLHPVGGTKIFGVNFKPYGFYNLTGLSLTGLRDSAVESTAIFPEEQIAAIELCLQSSNITETAIKSIETMLLAQQKDIQKNDFLDEIVDSIRLKNGLLDPYTLIGGKTSIRSLQRYFKQVIGISPKIFCQVHRHKFILQLMYQNQELTWNELILGGYYYDYSHFQKDFIKFTQMKPSEYIPFKNPFAEKLL